MVSDNGVADGLHRLFVFGIRRVVREHSVRLKELAAADIRAEPCKNLCGVKAADSVAGVNNNLISEQRPVIFACVNLAANHVAQSFGVNGHEINLFD